MQSHLEGTSWLPADTRLTVSKAKDGRNPHSFIVSIGGPDVIGAVRVKVEMWQAKEEVLSSVKAVVAPVKLARGPASGMQTFVPTSDLPEIYADKVFALAARPYLKPRDVFDLHWLGTHGGLRKCSANALRVRLATYPNVTPSAWINKALSRRMELLEAGEAIITDLKRWLPSSWLLTEASAKDMATTAVLAIEQGIQVMREIRDENDYESSKP